MRRKSLILSVLLLGQVSVAQPLKVGELSNVERITDGPTRFENPRWSPDGTRISLTEEGYSGLYVMDRDGGNLVQLSADADVGYKYQWSADSREILVRDTRWVTTSEGPDRVHAAWSISLDGDKVRLSEDANYMQPASWRYSQSGVKSIFADGVKTLAPVLNKVPTSVMRSAPKTAVSNVSFITDSEGLHVVDASGAKKLINAGTSFFPSLSPDGTRVAFNEVDDIVVMNIDGSGKRTIARGFNVSWVNDSQIVYERTTDDGHDYTSGEIYINSCDGGAEKALTSTSNRIEMYPVVSPDASKLLFISQTDGQLYQADLK